MIPSFFRVTMSAAVCLLVGCADLETAQSGAQMTPQNKPWVAFLVYHSGGGAAEKIQGYYSTIQIVGPFPKITVTQTEQDRSMQLFGGDFSVYQEFDNNAEKVILSSNDPALISLHRHLVAIETAVATSPETARYQQALARKKLVDTAYSPKTEYHGENPLQVIERGGTEGDLQSVYDQADATNQARKVEAARLELAKERDPVAKKTVSGVDRSGNAVNKSMSRYALPSGEFLAVMQKYVPRGSKGWNMIRDGDPHGLLGPGGRIEYGTWNY